METYEPVAFVSLETGDDLIVSFFVYSSEDPTEGRSITLLRDVKWERLLPDEERGVKVSDEADTEEDWQDNFLVEVRVGSKALELTSSRYKRKLDLKRLSNADRKAMTKVLKRMNFDRRFRLKVAFT
jgi:FMN phosphatase YigB (HAD superfamily)